MKAQGGSHRFSPPRASYRLHVSGEFPLRAVSELARYLDQLGISHVYSSPLLRGGTGSTHRYDVVDPTMIDPDMGTDGDLRELAATLHRRGMGLILGMVPNHMVATSENPAWDDVLAHGPSSPFACWFDIDWDYPQSSGPDRLVLPILGERRSRAISLSQLILSYRECGFRIGYFQHDFPIDPATIPSIFAVGTREGEEHLNPEDPDVQELWAVTRTLQELPPRTTPEPALRLARRSQSQRALERLRTLCERSTRIRGYLDRAVTTFAEAGHPGPLERLLDKQCFRLVHWRRAVGEVNYRRFFDVDHLVALRAEDPAVFEATHARILGWVAEELIDGLTIHHVDGLLDPLSYLERLRSAVAQIGGQPPDNFSIYVDKILGRSETLPGCWPVQGTTGYDFLNDLEVVFLAPDGIAAIETWYRRTTASWKRESGFATLATEAKRQFLEGELAADVERLTRLLVATAQDDCHLRKLSARDLRTAVIEVAACLPVYRTYLDDRSPPVGGSDPATVETAVAAARSRRRARPAALDLMRRLLLREGAAQPPRSDARDQLTFVQSFQQTTASAMAKGLEGTALYTWIPLVSLNNLGGRPDRPLGDAVMAFHLANRERLQRWPGAMICTTTDDTKRSADVRARLDVLSEIPEIWTDEVNRWRRLNRRHRRRLAGRLAPDTNTEYLLYQTLVGIWPLPEPGKPPDTLPDAPALEGLREQVTVYMRTAAREAKRRTSWTDPNSDFEAALDGFVRALIHPGDPGETPAFLSRVARLVARIRRPGLWNALGKTLAHLTAPGVPNIYQGDELWNFNLVDPDNRRPVDFEYRKTLLRDLEDSREEAGALRAPLIRELVEWPEDGRIKLWVISCTLGLRRDDPSLFSLGDYAPIRVEGARSDHVLTFTQRHDDRTALIVVPRLVAGLIESPECAPLGARVWRDTCLRLPAHLRGSPLRNVFTDSTHVSTGTRGGEFLRVAEVLDTFPVALLVAG